jgi:hypothetical protein
MNEWQVNTGVAPDLPEGTLVDVEWDNQWFYKEKIESWDWDCPDAPVVKWRVSSGQSLEKSKAAFGTLKPEQPVRNKYMREIKPGVWVDVYDVIRAFNVTDGALQHLLKKALAVGQRGHKDAEEDYKDILASAERALQIYKEWNE